MKNTSSLQWLKTNIRMRLKTHFAYGCQSQRIQYKKDVRFPQNCERNDLQYFDNHFITDDGSDQIRFYRSLSIRSIGRNGSRRCKSSHQDFRGKKWWRCLNLTVSLSSIHFLSQKYTF